MWAEFEITYESLSGAVVAVVLIGISLVVGSSLGMHPHPVLSTPHPVVPTPLLLIYRSHCPVRRQVPARAASRGWHSPRGLALLTISQYEPIHERIQAFYPLAQELADVQLLRSRGVSPINVEALIARKRRDMFRLVAQQIAAAESMA